MNKIYKLVWSKVRNSYVVASELAKSHTKSPKSDVMNQAVVSGVLACVLACGAVFPVYAAGQEVTYDDNTNETITLQGPTGQGTKITNLADGTISAGSSDAVTGKQLYSLKQTVDGFQSSLSTLNTTIASTQTTLNTTKATVLGMQDTLSTTATAVETGFNVNINGAKVKTVNPNSNYINFVSGKGITLSNSNNGIKIDVSADGVVASGDTGAITGGLAYTELRPADGNYVVQANTTAQNLTALDTQLKTAITGLAQEVTDRTTAVADEKTARETADTNLTNKIGSINVNGNYITKDGSVFTNLSALDTQLKTVADNAGALSADGNYITQANTVSQNLQALDTKIGSAESASGNYTTTANTVNANIKALDTQLKTTTDNLAQEVTARTNAISAEASARSSEDANLSSRIGTVANGIYNYIQQSSTKNISENLVLLDSALKTTNDTIASNKTAIESALATEVTARTNADTELMNKIGSINSDGNYITKNGTVFGNLSALDTRAKVNADAIASINANAGTLTENGNYILKDNTISQNLQALDAKIGSAESANGTYTTTVNTVNANIKALDTQLKTTTDNLAIEITDRTNAINTEKTARETADTELGNRITALSGNAVHYDGEEKTTITFEGNGGTTLSNVKTGTLSADSTEAVNGSQLYSTNQALSQEVSNRETAVANEKSARETADTTLSGRIGTISADGNYIKDSEEKNLAENVELLDTALKTANDTIIANKTAIEGALTDEETARQNADTALGERINAVSGNTVHYDTDVKTKVTLEGTGGTILDNVKAGTLSADSKEAVNGSQLYTTNQALAQEVTDRTTAINTEKTARETADTNLMNKIGSIDVNGNYITKDGTVFGNLSALDTGLVQEVTDRTDADTALSDRIDALDGNAVQYDDATKAKVTLGGTNGTTLDNVAAGTLSANSMEAVNGSQLYTTNQNLATEISNRQTAITNEATARSDADTALGNRIGSVAIDGNYIKDSSSKSVSENLGLLDIQVKANADAIMQEITDRGIAITNEASARSTEDTNLSNRIGVVASDGNYIKASSTKNVAENLELLDTQLKTTADGLASEITRASNAETALGNRIGTLATNGNYIATTNDVYQNLTALDTQVKANADTIVANKTKYFGVNAQFEVWTDANADALKAKYGIETKEEYEALIANGLNIYGDGAVGSDSIAIGRNVSVIANNGVAIGTNSSAGVVNSVAIGPNSEAGRTVNNVTYGMNSIAIGSSAQSFGEDGIAIGSGAKTLASGIDGNQFSANQGIAIGKNALSNNSNAIAIGYSSSVTGNDSIALGSNTHSNGGVSVAIGNLSKANTFASVAVGYSAQAGDEQNQRSRASAFGNNAQALGQQSTALGESALAKDYGSLAVGYGSVADGFMTAGMAGGEAKGNYSIAIGESSYAKNASSTIVGAYSYTSDTNSEYASAFGYDNHVLSNYGIALGNYAGVSQNAPYSVAVGYASNAGNPSIQEGDDNSYASAFGVYANALAKYSTAIGHCSYARNISSLSVGDNSNAISENSVAIGHNASAGSLNNTIDVGFNAIAIGSNTSASGANSVALGSNSSVSDVDVLSLGKNAVGVEGDDDYVPEYTRKIQHVTAGVNDTDAVNVSQLTELKDSLETSIANSTAYFSVNSTETPNRDGKGATGVDAMAIGDGASASGNSSAALGDYADAKGLRSIAVGNSAGAENDYGIAIGGLAKAQADGAIALGTSAKGIAANSMALGNSAKAEGATSYAIGQAANAKGESAIALGTSTEAALTGVAIGHMAKAAGESGVAIGTGTNAAKTAIALGHGANASVEAAMAVGINSSATANHAVAIGTGSVASVANTVSFGNSTTKRRLVNLANGVENSDAATVGQVTSAISNAQTRYFGVNADPEGDKTNELGTGASGLNSIAIGSSPVAGGINSIAIGSNASAAYENSIAIGYNSQADEENVVSFGKKAVMDGDTTITPELTRKLIHIRSGAITETSTEAINGSQLYSVRQDISGFATDINKNSENIRELNTSVTSALASVAASGLLVDTMDANKADASLNNLTASGKRLLKTYAENAVQEYMAAQGLNSSTAPVAPMAVGNTNSNTLSITDAGNGSLHVGEGSYVNGTSSIAIGVGNQVNANNSGAFGDPSIINADESYVLGNDDTINSGATGSFIVGNDSVSDAKGALILGSNTKANVGAENGIALGNHAEVSAKNAIALGSGSVAGEENTLSIGNTELQRKIVNMADGSIAEGSHEAVTGGQLFVTNENVQKNADAIEANRQAMEKKAEVDASNINIADWAAKLGVGKVEDGNKDLVTGGAVYNAMQDIKAVADFVKESDGVISIAPNSAATKINIGGASGEGRVLTGIVTDANDASSAANVGYVNDVTTNIANQMNRGLNKVNDRLDKVGAGAAAMAGLVPGPMDGDEKWSFSASVGNYKSATAGAVGAFYKPTDNVMIAVKGSFGNDENMVSGGVGISLNKGNVPGVSKAQMVRTINAQANEIQGLKASNEAQIAMIQNQANEIAELKAMMTELASKIK